MLFVRTLENTLNFQICSIKTNCDVLNDTCFCDRNQIKKTSHNLIKISKGALEVRIGDF